MRPGISRWATTAALATAILAVVLFAPCMSLSAAIHSARHACCEGAGDHASSACLTLCIASDAHVPTVAAEKIGIDLPAAVAVELTQIAQADVEPAAHPPVRATDSSPPLYLQHASLLI